MSNAYDTSPRIKNDNNILQMTSNPFCSYDHFHDGRQIKLFKMKMKQIINKKKKNT